MGKRTQIVMLVTVLSFVIIIMMQGSVFDNTNAIGQSLTNFAQISHSYSTAAIRNLQNNGNAITEQLLSPVTQQIFSDAGHNSFEFSSNISI